jgi:outer membrane protein assembly factor BamB
MIKTFRLQYILAIFLFISASSSAQDGETSQWTRFRGAGGLGLDMNSKVPVVWDSTAYDWNIELPGTGNSSPVVWDNKIFVTSSDIEKHLGYALAVNDSDGKIVWKKEFDVKDLKMHADNDLAMPTPAIDESQLYIVWYSIEKTSLYALDHDGTTQWLAEFDGIEARHGGGNSLMLTEENVIFTREQENGSSLTSSWIAVNKQTGETVWEIERNTVSSNSFSTPFILETEKGKPQLIFSSQAHGLTAVNPETGQILWERDSLLASRAVASPFYTDGKIMLSSKDETMTIEYDHATSMAVDTALYSLPRSLGPYVPTPIVVGMQLFLFMDNGVVACLDYATGDVFWKERPAGAIYGSPVCIGGNIYCITKAGNVLVIQANSNYNLKGITDLGEGSFSTPSMCKKGMVLRTFSRLMLLGSI